MTSRASVTSDPPHPLFRGLARAQVRDLHFERGLTSRDDVIELTLGQGREVRTFRFTRVTDLRLGGGFPEVGWLRVHDVSGRRLDGIGVRVSDGEQSEAIAFWAAGVEELTRPAA